mgnify:CR=1 FL=1
MAVKKIGTLNKHENPSTNENEFDIEDYMNANWDKIKEVVDNNADELSETQANKVDKVDGKGLSTEDFTTGLKAKLEGLSNYNDTEIKEDIQDIKSEQTTQNTKLQELEDNQIHITTERASNLNVQDASGQNAKIKLFGISKQEGTPSPKSPSEIENTTGNVKITSCNKNLFNKNTVTEGKNIGNNGEFVINNNYFISDYILINKNVSLALTGIEWGRIAFYDKDKNFIKYSANAESNDLIATSTEDTKYAVISSTIATIDNVQLEVSNTATDFEAHEEEVKTFPLSQNQKMYRNSYSADDGIHHKRKQIELDGTETVIDSGYNETTHHFTIRPTDKAFGQTEILSNMFVNSTEATKVYSVVGNNSNTNITFKMPLEYATVDSFKTFLAQRKQAGTPVIVEYPLSEEEVEEYTEEQQTQRDQLQNAKTYKTVTNVFTDNAEVEMNYIADTKTYVDNEINSIKNQLNKINQLLSTTTTSAILLDNMQSDLESEVL